jgi:predicted methyltransferase
MIAIRSIRSAVFLVASVAACNRTAADVRDVRDVRTDPEIRAALSGPARTDAEVQRDAFRHPRETLEFFGLRDDMHVVELWAPGGFYTAILAPVLREHGALSVAFVDPGGDFQALQAQPKKWQTEASQRYVARLDQSPNVFDRVTRIVMKPPAFSFGPDGSADLVLTFRNVHNWIPEGYQDAIFAAAFRVLKPGGVLGIEEHRGAPDMTDKQIEDTGYVPEERIIALATKAGFRLSERSEINANPKDTKDYVDGVWTLPPTYSRKNEDRARYAAIGESDRMTLKFGKP